MTTRELYIDFCNNFKKTSTLTRDSKTPEWTKNIYDYFYRQGVNGFKVYARPDVTPEGEGEYLVDLCWSREERVEYRNYKGLELILECEWNTTKDEIMWDFCKLVDVKSFLKTMVICIPEKEVDNILQEMAETIKSSRIKFKQESYLVIIFIPIPKIYNPERYIIQGYEINTEGASQKLPPVDFVFD